MSFVGFLYWMLLFFGILVGNYYHKILYFLLTILLGFYEVSFAFPVLSFICTILVYFGDKDCPMFLFCGIICNSFKLPV